MKTNKSTTTTMISLEYYDEHGWLIRSNTTEKIFYLHKDLLEERPDIVCQVLKQYIDLELLSKGAEQ